MKKLLIVFSIMTLFIAGCGGGVISDDKLKNIYKELDYLDFKTQEEVADVEKVTADLAKIYSEPQLSNAKAYLNNMRQQDLKFILEKVDYKRIDILSKTEDNATLEVENLFSGKAVSIKDPGKTLQTIKDKSDVLQVKLVRQDGKWLISEVIYK